MQKYLHAAQGGATSVFDGTATSRGAPEAIGFHPCAGPTIA